MVSQTLAARSAFTNWKPVETPQLAIDTRETLTLASFSAFKGKKQALKAAIRERYGVDLPETPIRNTNHSKRLMWSFRFRVRHMKT